MDAYNYKFPLNYKKEWENLFKEDRKHLKVNLKCKTINNVFVNHYGLILKNGFLNFNCAPNLKFSFYDTNVYYRHWRKAFEQLLVCKYGKSLKSKKLDDSKLYLIIHSPWFSYYFWITECLPRLLRTLDKYSTNEFILIYPESWKKISFVNETLAHIPNLQIEEVDTDTHLFISNLIITDVKPWTPMFIPSEVTRTRDFLFRISELSNDKSIEEDARVYISRAAAKRRKFSNEEEVEELFKKYNYKIIQMENLSFFQQIQLMKKTKLLAGLTGAGLINILFMKKKGAFLDLSNERYKNKTQYKFHYFKLCNILNISYSICFFKSEITENIDHWSNENLIADIEQIEIEIIKQINNVEKS